MISRYFQKNEKELETQINTKRIYSLDIEIEFGIEKCAMLKMKSGKRETAEGIELPNQENIKTVGEKKNYKILGILGMNTIKQEEIKEKNKKRVPQKNKTSQNQALKQKFN